MRVVVFVTKLWRRSEGCICSYLFGGRGSGGGGGGAGGDVAVEMWV